MAAWTAAMQRASGTGREAHRVDGGNDQLANGLAAELGARVRLGCEVSSIDQRTGQVVLAGGEQWMAGHVVAAVPLPVLGRMWPTMPPELAAVGYGVGGKVSVQFDRRLWLDGGHDGSVVTERAWGELWETTDGQGGDRGVLTALLSSHDGAALASMSDVDRRIVDEVERIFPGARGMAGERVVTDWTHDPASLGAYATFGPGQLSRAWPVLQQVHDRVVLAGEHASPWAGFMEGALRSGARAARLVLGEGGTPEHAG
jgi:monoamine oxidase